MYFKIKKKNTVSGLCPAIHSTGFQASLGIQGDDHDTVCSLPAEMEQKT